MSGKITDVFRQQKPHSSREGSSKDGSKRLAPLPGVTAADAVIDVDVSQEEHILRQFDLDSKYGPCTGMTRMERWQRAQKFGLNPPAIVQQLLSILGEGSNRNVWDGRV